ncbi:MAG TPA: hypothetical protein VFU81_09025, partial [Thermomicrobiales bacterium]|nr:hypothetical protein [Thermomicrobiales bacterium]
MPATKSAAAPATKTAKAAKQSVGAKTAPAKKAAAPAKKAAPVKKPATPVKKAVATKKAAPSAKRAAAPAKKATRPVAKKAVAAKKAAAPAKKAAAPAKKTVAAKRTSAAAKKAAAPAKKVTRPVAKPVKGTTKPRPRKAAVAPAPTVTVQNVAASPEPRTAEERWRGHPVAANIIRAVAVAIPLAASVASGVLLSRAVHRPSGVAAVAAWWLGLMVASTAVLVAVDRVARRILPLATLLKLSMAFPDQAPSRFSVAARAGTTRSLQEQLRRAQDEGITDGPAQAAHRILTLVGALGAHDRRTRGHSERVRAFNDLIAEEMR